MGAMHRFLINLRGLLVLTVKQCIYLGGLLLVKPWLVGWRSRPKLDVKSRIRILYIAVAYRGDLIINFPAINALKRCFPKAEIHCWVNEYSAELARANRNVSQVIATPEHTESIGKTLKKYWRSSARKQTVEILTAGSYDVCLDDAGTAFTTLMAFGARIPFRIGRNGQGLGFLNHKSVPLEFNANLYQKRLRMLRVLGIEKYEESDWSADHLELPEVTQSQLAAKTNDGRPLPAYFTVQAFAGWRAKNWTNQAFAESIDKISAFSGLMPVFIGSSNDSPGVEAIRTMMKCDSVNSAGKLNLLESAEMIRRAKMHLGVDSVGSHIAAVFRVRSVTIFGPTNPRKIAILSQRQVAVRKIAACSPRAHQIYCCYDGGRSCSDLRCLKELRPEHVTEAALDVWKDQARPLYEF